MLIGCAMLAAGSRASTSVYPLRPDAPAAVYVKEGNSGAIGDGLADDTAALQAAIDRVQATTRRGIVFVPSGRYRLTKTLLVWSGIRLIGYGATRPVFVLGQDTPGFQSGEEKYLVHFVSDRPTRPDQPVRDANPGTFYSAMSNIDLEIEPGNPAAVGVRSHYAQHCFLEHMEFRIGEGRAGVEEVGNQSSDLHFFGGEFGITTHKPSPSWPFVLLDATFEGQRRAAIETEEGGLTLIRPHVKNVPTVVLVREHRSEELYLEDGRIEAVSGPALVISEEPSARTQINVRNTEFAATPVLAEFRESGRRIAGGGALYRVKTFTHGLQFADPGAEPVFTTTSEIEPIGALTAPVPSDIAALPPMETWTDVRTLGAKGDGKADDTAALRAAIAAHRVLYFPSGRYRITDTLTLRPDTVLIGFNPITTQIVIDDFTAAFQGVNGPTSRPQVPDIPGVPRRWLTLPPFPGRGAPVPLIATPRGGTNIVSGLGLDTGGVNNRAVALLWRAGEHSLVNDVRFLGGHGTYGPDGEWLSIYNDNHTADPDSQRKWDSQFPSLWVTDGGGGTFLGCWSPSPFAAAGMQISDTETPGRVYALSSEHHVRHEVTLRRAAHWSFYGLQTEEERGESPHALPLEIDAAHDVHVANFFAYRVETPEPFVTAIRVTRSHDLTFSGLHVYSPGKLSFDNTLVDATHGIEVRAREIARLAVTGNPPPSSPTPADAPVVKKLAGGFTAIDGLVGDGAGGVCFVDQKWSTIYHWSEAGGISVVTTTIPEPVALALDRAGSLLVVSHHGNVYALKLGASDEQIAVLPPTPASASTAPQPDATAWLPTNRWRDSHDWIAAATRREPLQYVSPDASVVVPAPESFPRLTQPRGGWGAGTIDLRRTYQLGPARAGGLFYAADEFGQTTWRFRVQPDGSLAEPFRFAEEGEAGVTTDAAGNVYVCAGQVFVYAPDGRLIETIAVPERPSAVGFGGADGRTLFIAARSSLYAVRPTAASR